MFNETADRNGFNAATTFMSILYNRGYIFDEKSNHNVFTPAFITLE